ncbi:MAG: ATP-binding protein [Thermodesulfobacteriota bacterium]
MIRNRLITNTFGEGGLIRKYGTGVTRIFNAFHDYGLPEPRFEEVARGLEGQRSEIGDRGSESALL